MIINLIKDMISHFFWGISIAIRFLFLKAAFFGAVIVILFIAKLLYMAYKKNKKHIS